VFAYHRVQSVYDCEYYPFIPGIVAGTAYIGLEGEEKRK
jgi:hypothetical protein